MRASCSGVMTNSFPSNFASLCAKGQSALGSGSLAEECRAPRDEMILNLIRPAGIPVPFPRGSSDSGLQVCQLGPTRRDRLRRSPLQIEQFVNRRRLTVRALQPLRRAPSVRLPICVPLEGARLLRRSCLWQLIMAGCLSRCRGRRRHTSNGSPRRPRQRAASMAPAFMGNQSDGGGKWASA